jgi:hypothetical protein
MKRRIIGPLIAAISVLVLPASSSALTLGQLATSPTNLCVGQADILQLTITSGNGYVVPSTGGISTWTVTAWSTNASSNSAPIGLKFFRKVGDPATYQVVGHDGPQQLKSGLNTFTLAAPFDVKAGDVLGLNINGNSSCAITASSDEVLERTGNLGDGQTGDFVSDGGRLNETAQLSPASTITLGKPKAKSNGTAVLPVTVVNPGSLTVSGGGAAKVSSRRAVEAKQVAGPGTVKVKIEAKGLSKRRLERKGKVKVDPKITFTATGGIPNSVFRKIKLHTK